MAKDFVEWSASQCGEISPLAKEANRQQDSISRILKLSAPARAGLAEADVAAAGALRAGDLSHLQADGRLYENVLGSFESARTISGKKFAPGQPLPKAEALREAKQWLRNLPKLVADKLVQKALGEKAQAPKGDHPFADPYYWAAFVLVGNGD